MSEEESTQKSKEKSYSETTSKKQQSKSDLGERSKGKDPEEIVVQVSCDNVINLGNVFTEEAEETLIESEEEIPPGEVLPPYPNDEESEIFEMIIPKQQRWYRNGNQVKLMVMMFLTFSMMVGELVVGFSTGSLALVSDAFHMASDTIALIIAFVAISISKKESTPQSTYGLQRSEVIGAFVNGIFLLSVCFFIFLEAIQRFIALEEVENPLLVVYVGCAGIGINIIGLIIFSSSGGHGHSHGGGGHGHSHGGGHGHSKKKSKHSHDGGHSHDDHSHSHKEEHSQSDSHSGEEDSHDEEHHSHSHKGHGHKKHKDKHDDSHSQKDDSHSDKGHGHKKHKSHKHKHDEDHSHSHEDDSHSHEDDSHSHEDDSHSHEDDSHSHEDDSHSDKGHSHKKHKSHKDKHDEEHPHEHKEHSHKKHGHKSKHSESDTEVAKTPKKRNDNMKAVYLHVLGDFLGSVAAITSGLLINFLQFHERYYFDPILSLFIVALILKSCIPVIQRTLQVLMQKVPTFINIDNLKAELAKVPGVVSIHELHVWTLVGNKLIGTVHVSCLMNTDFMLIAKRLKETFHKFNVHSTTIQPEFLYTHQLQKKREVCKLSCLKKDTCKSESCCPPTYDEAIGEAELKSLIQTTRKRNLFSRAPDAYYY
jgi:zinc transporter 1